MSSENLTLGNLFGYFVHFFTLLILGCTDDSRWTTVLVLWAVRLVSFSLVFRTYIGPWILARLSGRIKVRSVSLRSIRGIYFRTGSRTLHVDRIGVSYRSACPEGSSRLSIKIENARLEIDRAEVVRVPPPKLRPRGGTISLADLSPSPLAFWLWSLLASIHSILDPYFRPIIRTCFVAGFRILIRSLPALTQHLDFELSSAVVTFSALPGTRVVIKEAFLHTEVAFTQLENVIPGEEELKLVPQGRGRSLSMAAWKARLSKSFGRTWDRAWGKTQGSVSFSLNIKDVKGLTTPSREFTGSLLSATFFDLPGAIALSSSVSFNPKHGTLEPHSLSTTFGVDAVYIAVDTVRSLLTKLKSDDAVEASAPCEISDSVTVSSPVSPISPIMEVLSSFSSHPRLKRHFPMKSRARGSLPWISSLMMINIQISSLRMSYSPVHGAQSRQSYEATTRNVKIGAKLSDPDQNALHRDKFGLSHKTGDNADSDVYAFNFSVDKTTLDRYEGVYPNCVPFKLLLVGPVDFQTLASRWPSPWLQAAQFISGDANAALLVIRLTIATVEVTEHLEVIQRLVNQLNPPARAAGTSPLLPAALYPVPRLDLGVECGSIRGTLLCSESQESSEPISVEVRTDGLVLSMQSHFFLMASSSLRNPDFSDRLPYQMKSSVAFLLQPTFLRVRSSVPTNRNSQRFSKVGVSDSDIWGDSLLSLETIEIKGDGVTLGEFNEDTDTVVSLDVLSTFLDLHCSSEILSVELWQPTVVAATSQIISIAQTNSRATTSPSSPTRMLDRLPLGICATLSIARFTALIASQDLNPNDDQELSRGLAFRTGIRMQYCALHSGHVQYFKDLHVRSLTRHKLYLSEDRIVEALSAAKASSVTRNRTISLQIAVWATALRSAVTTQYVADDPYMAERDDPAFKAQEYLRLPSATGDLYLTGKQGINSNVEDKCHVVINVPSVEGTFQIAHIYHLLLALRAVRSLVDRRTRPVANEHSKGMSYSFKGTVKVVQFLWDLPGQRLATRVDSLSAESSSARPYEIRWTSIFFWVPLPPKVSRWEESVHDRWQELGHLRHWRVLLPRHGSRHSRITVDGDSARIRIPYGYVVADLILDASLTFKCIRHLMNMVEAGYYTGMPPPEAEGPKSMPNLFIRLKCLSLEASDDELESKLGGLIWRSGLEAVKHRITREEAFRIKVATILAQNSSQSPMSLAQELDSDYRFSANHSVSVEEARERLSQVHIADWIRRHHVAEERRSNEEAVIVAQTRGANAKRTDVPDIVTVQPFGNIPPLFRAVFHDLSLNADPPSFPLSSLPDVLFEQGDGLPRDAEFSLLLPMHLNFTISSLRVSLRDYPLPLIDIPPNTGKVGAVTLEFDTDLVIAEEMGTAHSVDWFDCSIVEPHKDIPGGSMSIQVPKTIMPVKSYARPIIRVTTDDITTFSWSMSYGPAIQDLVRVIDTLSHSPRDSSPGLGFWDKIRLVFHWNFKVSFKEEVRFHMKGGRDPYELTGVGAGFALCWQGNPKLSIGHSNEDRELVQAISDTILIVIPNFEEASQPSPSATASSRYSAFHNVQKVCAKFSSGVRFGVGFVLERSCGPECTLCTGSDFDRRCRFFAFRPHYSVKLEVKPKPPVPKSKDDSYSGFRSDFIHMSISLTSSVRSTMMPGTHASPSSLYLTPKSFAHFWSWWALFDGLLSLPIRQGGYYTARHPSPKFGRHLATIKWRISVSQLFISHAYIDDSRESWVDGITPFVGVKAMIDHFQADMHQRDQETTMPGATPDALKVARHKAFYAVEVVLKGLDLRALLAIFADPLKQSVPVTAPQDFGDNYRTRNNDMPVTDPSSIWVDMNDFVESDWSPSNAPTVHLLPAVHCPHFTYFKRNPKSIPNDIQNSKFGTEDTHACLLGKEASVPQIQIRLASDRIDELRKILANSIPSFNDYPSSEHAVETKNNRTTIGKMVSLLEDYVAHLRDVDVTSDKPGDNGEQSYYMPSDSVSPHEWAEFENVYQVHCPKIFVTDAVRDVMVQYYYCSRARRGFEYHMATRAVKFMRDQAQVALATDLYGSTEKPRGSAASSAQAAAIALRKILGGDGGLRMSVDASEEELPSQPAGVVDPLNGWSDGVSLRKSHFCLLLKPQVVLRSEGSVESVCVLAAVQAKLQAFAIMDDSNLEDPVSGKVMSRSYTSLNGLQAFSPAMNRLSGDGCVPLEVLIDFRCENNDFDRLVPQTDATFHYDKFNRLRLRNNVRSVVRASTDRTSLVHDNHLQNQTDLIRVHIPRFTVSASDEHFQDISNIVTKLILFSDPAHKMRLDKLETLLFTYDFTDLTSAAAVVENLQSHMRGALETQRSAELKLGDAGASPGRLELLKLKAHIFLLAEELNYIFDAIKLAQDRTDEHTDQKSALLLHASSSEISWRMLDDQRDLLAKLVVRDIDYNWLSRQDSTTVNNLAVGDLQAFDGSPNAVWAEILSKYTEPTNHPLYKRGLFILADWTVLAPVGRISIYEDFQVNLHPMRLQLDARVGVRIMEYLWPARRERHERIERDQVDASVRSTVTDETSSSTSQAVTRSSLDSSRPLQPSRKSIDSKKLAPPALHRLGSSRSYTDLRSASTESPFLFPPKLQRTSSTKASRIPHASSDLPDYQVAKRKRDAPSKNKVGDAAEMKTRSSQKTFVYVKISSLHLLLSILKEESFECRDARIRTRDLEYRNQTWSFEELVDQFIPSDMTWRGWVKMAFNQPLVPVLPVARELISKTKWITSKGSSPADAQFNSPKLLRSKPLESTTLTPESSLKKRSRTSSPHKRWRKTSHRNREAPLASFTQGPLTSEPEAVGDSEMPLDADYESGRQRTRSRMMSLFSRGSSRSRKSTDAQTMVTSTPRHSAEELERGNTLKRPGHRSSGSRS